MSVFADEFWYVFGQLARLACGPMRWWVRKWHTLSAGSHAECTAGFGQGHWVSCLQTLPMKVGILTVIQRCWSVQTSNYNIINISSINYYWGWVYTTIMTSLDNRNCIMDVKNWTTPFTNIFNFAFCPVQLKVFIPNK